MPQTALLLIDLQNDLLVEGGAFSRRHVEASALIDAARWAVDLARQRGHALVWIESVYGERAPTPDPQKRTHLDAPCCVRGSWGAEPVAPLRALADATSSGEGGSLRVEKPFYCAFHETPLHAWLGANGVTQLVLAGVATNTSVAATAKEARQLGYQVTVLVDATAAASLPRHLAALSELEAAGCRVRRWAELDGGESATLRDLGSGSALHLGCLPSVDDATLATLTAEVDWQTMIHRGGQVPRLVATQGDVGDEDARLEPLYRHPADDYPPVLPWTPSVARLRDEVAALVGHPFNHCLIQLYRDGRDWISAHSDKTLDLIDGSFIINVSVGALRTMTLRRKTAGRGDAAAAPREVQRVPLPHGSVMQMSLRTNRDWLHEIRQQGAAGEIGPRISLTFRLIGTFWNPATGAVWGRGSPHPARAAAERAAAARAALPEEERRRRELAEAERMLRLFRQENQSATFDRSAYQPGFEVVHLRPYQERAQRPAEQEGAR